MPVVQVQAALERGAQSDPTTGHWAEAASEILREVQNIMTRGRRRRAFWPARTGEPNAGA